MEMGITELEKGWLIPSGFVKEITMFKWKFEE
jgi:hypothetical protein